MGPPKVTTLKGFDSVDGSVFEAQLLIRVNRIMMNQVKDLDVNHIQF
jgi:hypothetical protein